MVVVVAAIVIVGVVVVVVAATSVVVVEVPATKAGGASVGGTSASGRDGGETRAGAGAGGTSGATAGGDTGSRHRRTPPTRQQPQTRRKSSLASHLVVPPFKRGTPSHARVQVCTSPVSQPRKSRFRLPLIVGVIGGYLSVLEAAGRRSMWPLMPQQSISPVCRMPQVCQ